MDKPQPTSTKISGVSKKVQQLLADENNHAEVKKCKESPLYFYNNYIRKEGEPVLTQEQYREYMKRQIKTRK